MAVPDLDGIVAVGERVAITKAGKAFAWGQTVPDGNGGMVDNSGQRPVEMTWIRGTIQQVEKGYALIVT